MTTSSPAASVAVLDAPSEIDGRAMVTLAKARSFTTEALRLILETKETILSGFALALAELRDKDEPVQAAYAEVLAVVEEAARRFGPPRHFVTDQGSQFKSADFSDLLERLGAKHRFGAIGKTGSVAIIERFWRSTKDALGIRLLPPLSPKHLTDRLGPALDHYSFHRPHQGLGGATPAERYFCKTAASPVADLARLEPALVIRPPEDLPYRLVYLDAERRFPVLVEEEQIAA